MPLFSAVENQVSLILCLSRSAVELGGEMMTQSTVACRLSAYGKMGMVPRPRRGTLVRAVGWRVGGVVIGLTLCPACESGDKDCALTTGTLELSIELADDYSESMQDNFDDRMRLVIFHLDEEPETEANCTQFPHEAVLISNHGLDLDDAFEILSGWVCAFIDGSYTTIEGEEEGEETQTNCYGYLAPVEVPACETVDFPMVVTCEVESYEGN